MALKATLLLCAAIVDGWKAPPQKLLKPLATKLLEASLAVTTLGALPAVAAPPQQQHEPSRKYLFVTGFPFPLGRSRSDERSSPNLSRVKCMASSRSCA